MARISLQTAEQIQLLQQRYAQTGEPNPLLSRLSPGDILQAKVVNALGNNLFSLNIAGGEFTTSSKTPLSPGQQLTLQVTSNPNGQPNLRVVTLTEGTIAGPSSRPSITGLENQQASRTLESAVTGQIPTTGSLPADTAGRLLNGIPSATLASSGKASTSEPAVLVQLQSLASQLTEPPGNGAETISPRLAKLLQPGGPVARLVSERPDLAPRIEELLRVIQQRPSGLGQEIEQLVNQLSQVLRSSTPQAQTEIRTTQDRLVSQLFDPTTLERPEQLARQLADRIGQWARGFEGTLARELSATNAGVLANATVPREASPVDPGAARGISLGIPDSTENHARNSARLPASASISVDADLANTAAKSPAVSSNSAQVIRGTFEGDLKGQLLELRGQLEALGGNRQDVPQAIQQAIARVDTMLSQVTAQQIRNLQGLNQYLYAELPVDPRTGIQEARLQVFYRNQGSTPKPVDADRFTVALFLSLSKLGDVAAVVSGVDRAVTVGFTVDDPTVAGLLESQGQLLRDSLVKSGHVGATVTVRQSIKESLPRASDDPVWAEFIEVLPGAGDPGAQLDAEA